MEVESLFLARCPGRAGRGAFQQLYSTLHTTATHVGMSPDCSKLGLGVADACTRRAASATQSSWVIPVDTCKTLHNLGYPNKTRDIPVLMTYSNISRDIPKLNKNRWDFMGYLEIKQKHMKYPGITRHVTYPGISKDKYVYPDRHIPTCSFSLLDEQQAGISRV